MLRSTLLTIFSLQHEHRTTILFALQTKACKKAQ